MKQILKPILAALALTILATPNLRADDSPPPGSRIVGTTYDWCRTADVTFQSQEGTARVRLGDTRLVMLRAKTKELTWYCGTSKERCANDELFTWVRCVHLGDGRIKWTFYIE